MMLRYCSKATSQMDATFCDLRARNECVLSMRTSLDFRILYAKTNVAKESSATGCKYIDRFIRRRVFFVNLAQILILQRYKGLSSVRFVSRVACEFQRDTSKDNRSFVKLPLSSTVVRKLQANWETIRDYRLTGNSQCSSVAVASLNSPL